MINYMQGNMSYHFASVIDGMDIIHYLAKLTIATISCSNVKNK